MAIDVRHEAPANVPARRAWTVRSISAMGPLTVVAGALWALLQPYRITLLDPRGEGFWWLVVEPPLLVIAVGVVFHLLVARPLVADLGGEDA